MSLIQAIRFKQYHLRNVVDSSRGNYIKPSTFKRLKLVTATIWQYSNANEPKMQLRDIPGPSMFENLTTISRKGFRKHHVFIEEMFERFGPIFRHSVPGEHFVYLSDPVDIEHVYRSQESNKPYRGDILLALYAKKHSLEGGLAADDETWTAHRKLIAPKLLKLGVLKPYFTDILNVADDTVANFNEGCNYDLQDHITKWAAESVGVVLFGLRMGTNYKTMNERAKAFINAVNGYFHEEGKLVLSVPLYQYVETPTLRRAYRHFDTQVAITRAMLAETGKLGTKVARNSLAMRFMLDDNVSEENAMFICNNLLVAGIHTTGSSAIHLFHALSRLPEVQRKIYEEMKRVLGEGQKVPTYQDLSEMKYLRAAIREGFRYNAAPPGNLRVTKVPVNVRGYHIPAGTKVILSTLASKEMQRQKYVNPEKFSPERWLRITGKDVHPFSSLPFSFGKRHCVGKRLVDMEMSLLVLRYNL